MSDLLIAEIEKSHLKTNVPKINVGDTVGVHVRIIEGAKERIQIFKGVVIKIQGTGLTQTFTVRHIVANEGVERTFPTHSPKIAQVDIMRQGDTRRSKLYYLRERVGKKRRLRDRRRGLAQAILEPETPDTPEAPAPETVATEDAAEKPAE